jgi:tetratricopeptide (TPR) repeat protein
MTQETAKYRLELLGAFRLTDPSGERIPIISKRAKALLAALATARNGERSRSWLQDRLWGSRGQLQAQASLRREMSNLRPLVNVTREPILCARHDVVNLALDRVEVDVRDEATAAASSAEFLEGIDLKGEEGFEDWLRQMRQRIEGERQRASNKGQSADGGSSSTRTDAFEGKPSIAVVGMVDGMGPDRAALIASTVEMLVERISRVRWLTVIAAPAAASFGGGPDIRSLGASLGASYLLHAQLAPGGSEMRLGLSEGASGRLIWSRRYLIESALDRGPVELVGETVAATTARIEVEQQLRVLGRDIQQLTPDERVWRARWHTRRLTREDADIAERLLADAAAEKGSDAAIVIEQGFLAAWRIWASRGGTEEKKAFRQLATRARHTDPYDARAYHLCGVAEMWLGRHEAARAMFVEALKLNPSLSGTYGQLGSCHSLAGDPAAAIAPLETALRLNPLSDESFHQWGELALARFMLGRHREAIDDADRSLALRPAYFYAHAIKIAAFVELGDSEGEQRAWEAFAAAKPEFPPGAIEWLPFRDRRWIRKLREALDPPPLRLVD